MKLHEFSEDIPELNGGTVVHDFQMNGSPVLYLIKLNKIPLVYMAWNLCSLSNYDNMFSRLLLLKAIKHKYNNTVFHLFMYSMKDVYNMIYAYNYIHIKENIGCLIKYDNQKLHIIKNFFYINGWFI